MFTNFQRSVAVTTLTLGLLTVSSAAQAFSFVGSRAEINESDRIDWSTVGTTFSPFGPPDPAAFLPSTFKVASNAGTDAQVNIPAAPTPGITPPFVFQTTDPGIPTNFAAGDFILFTGLIPGPPPAVGNPGPITLSFDTPVQRAGAQIAVDDTFNFTASISAFDQNDALLGTFSSPGTASTTLDNSAVFLGVSDTTASISKLVFSASIPGRAIGINQVSLFNAPVTATPEPVSAVALLIFGSSLAYRKRLS